MHDGNRHIQKLYYSPRSAKEFINFMRSKGVNILKITKGITGNTSGTMGNINISRNDIIRISK